jgi:PEGA domain
MSRVRLVAATAFALVGLTLAGCSSVSWMPSMPSWLKPAPAVQALQFETDPPGADVHAADGQTCRTPCSLALPLTAQSVNFAMNGYLPQSVSVDVTQSAERQADNSFLPPNFVPNPVEVTLQAAGPQPVAKPKPHKPVRTSAAKPAAPRPAAQVAPARDSAFPPLPPVNAAYPAGQPVPSPYPSR